MAITVKHTKVSTVPDGDDTSVVRPSDWNDDHVLVGLGTAAELDAGVANGVATLDSGGKVPTSELPAAILGALNYQGTWNASTNTPTLTSSVGTKGYYYVVSVAGNTDLNGITDWQIGDWAVYNGSVWQKVDNTDAGGDVVGPASATDNAITRFDGTTGKLIQNSVVTMDDTGNIAGATLTSPKINEILDTNGNEILGLSPTTSATDYLTVKNGIGVGVPLHVYAEGSSSNIGLHIQPKGTGLVTISDGTDFNKGIRFRSSGSSASAVTLLDAVATAGRVVTLPNATTTLVGKDTTDTLTNKSISGTDNTLSNIGNASLTNSAITINGTSTSLGGSISVGTVTSVTGTAPVVSSGGATPAISMAAATSSVNGYLTSTDWTTFNNKSNTNGTVTSVAALTLGTTGTDLSSTVANGTTTPVITLQVPTASATNRGALSAADWTTFNNKAPAVTYTTNYIPYGQGTTTPNQSAGLQFDGTNFTTTGYATATSFRPSSATVPTNGMYLPAANSVGLATNTTERMRIDSSGNVIIGTTAALLSAGSRGNITLNGASDSVIAFGNAAATSAYLYSNASSFEIDATGARYLSFRTNSLERLRIDTAGNMGIGVTPVAGYGTSIQLKQGASSVAVSFILQSISTSNQLLFIGNNALPPAGGYTATYNYTQTGAPATGYIQYQGSHIWYTAAAGTSGNAITFTQPMTLFASGGVSIGNTTDPGATNLSVTGLTSSARFVPTGSTVPTNGLYLPAANAVGLATNSTNRLYIDSAGLVGIGTASPATKLDVSGAKNTSIVSISASLSTVGGASFVDYSELLFKNTAAVNGDSSIRSYSNVWSQSGSNLAFFTNSASAITERMRIFSTGGVSIGNTTDKGAASLNVSGLIFPQQATTAAAPAYVKGAIYFDTTLNKLRVGGATAWETITSV